MRKKRIGILGASNIAFKRFLPSLKKSLDLEFAGLASREPARCIPFVERFGGVCYPDYDTLLSDPRIDCVYLPLPPALHYVWGKKALINGKHLLMEKPFCSSFVDTKDLLDIAESLNLAVHENYMFLYHSQLKKIRELCFSGLLGELRMIRTAFTFPFRGALDFRYHAKLGGGALLDCGGYPLLLASELLGNTAGLQWSGLNINPQYNVDIGGSVVLKNCDGLTAHIFFGMNDTYRCDLELWGSKASLTASRVFTAPPDLSVALQLDSPDGSRVIQVPPDDQFLNSINQFVKLILNPDLRSSHMASILRRSSLTEQIRNQGFA